MWLHISTHKCEVCIQPPKAKKSAELESFHPHGFETGSSYTPITDLRDYLTKKRSVNQMTPQYCYERLITAVLSKCHCSSHTSKLSVFNWLSVTWSSNSVKRHRSRKKISFSDVEYPDVSSNMVDPSTHQVSQRGSSWPSVLGRLMLNFLRVWKKY